MDSTTRLQAYLELTEAVSRARSVDAVYDAAIACVERSLGVSRAALMLFDDDGVLRFKAWRGVSDAQRTEIEGRSPWAAGAREAEAFVVADVFTDPRYEARREMFRREGIRTMVFIPLFSQGQVIGKFMLYHSELTTVTDEDLREARAVADQIALAIGRRQDDERLRALNSLLRGLVENLPVGVSYVDANDRLLYTNPALQNLIGVTSSALYVGQDVTSIRRAICSIFRDPEAYLRMSREQHARAVPVPKMELELLDGRTLERRYFPVRVDDTLVGHLVMLEDITERRTLEAQLLHAQKMDSIGHLAGGIAHDFNNLLMAITGHLGLALSEVPRDSGVHESLSLALEASTQAAALTRQLLAFARRQPVQPVTLDLAALLQRVRPLLRRMIREDIAVHEACPGEPLWVRADEGQLEQVLVNLVLNACDAMPDGGELWLECSRTGSGGAPRVRLSVRDSGTGMDAETRARVFEPFFTTKALGRGTGLGLATVYGIVQQSGGSIEVDSAPGTGTTFRLEFPVVEAPPPARPAAPVPPMPRGNETVLLVEDDIMVRLLAETMLRRLGYRVHALASAEEALAWSVSYDGELHLLLSDIVMPGMNGRELAKRLLHERPALRVVLMSGYAPPASDGAAAPGFAFLAKPFTAEALALCVHETLSAAPLTSAAGR